MSHIQQLNEGLVGNMWPDVLPKVDARITKDLSTRDLVPRTFVDLLSWAYVDRNPDRQSDHTRRHVLLHAMSSSDENGTQKERVVQQVAVRFQGFVQALNIRATGNWNGDEATCMKAVQFIRLVDGGYSEPFSLQVNTVNHFRELISRAVGKPVDRHKAPYLHFQRRVFTKVRPGLETRSVLRQEDDPSGRARAVATRWVIPSRLQTGVLRENGRVVACNPMLIACGDFVEVTAIFDIATLRSSLGTRLEVHLCPVRIVQLRERSSLAVRSLRPSHTEHYNRKSDVTMITEAGEEFDEEPERAIDGMDTTQ